MIEILQALLTPLVAVTTTYIAYQQYRIRRDERTLALYDRRLAMFKLASGIIIRVEACQIIKNEEAFEWRSSLAETRFLFGEEVDFVITSLWGALYSYSVETDRTREGEVMSLECVELVARVVKHEKALFAAFDPYLRPIGSPKRRKSRVSLAEVKAMLPKESEDDIPF